jgi:hypothetical protein
MTCIYCGLPGREVCENDEQQIKDLYQRAQDKMLLQLTKSMKSWIELRALAKPLTK